MNTNGADASHPSPLRWRRSKAMKAAALLALAAFVALGCSGSSETVAPTDSMTATEVQSATEVASATPAASAPAETAPPETSQPEDSAAAESVDDPVDGTGSPTAVPTPTPHPLAAAAIELPPAPIGFEALAEQLADDGPKPISLAITDIGVAAADVVPVGVNADDLSLEVPPADQVGWYEFGPAPGEPGASVLAAHIAYNGVDGVFRYLEDVDIGAEVEVVFDDGSTMSYRIEAVQEYLKDELPDELWEREGEERLVLITCGGAFNYQLDSYESNTVAIAVPVG